MTFSITGARGFHMTFPNDWTVSVQWGPGNYCDNRDLEIDGPRYMAPVDAAMRHGSWDSTTAEVAAWPGRGDDQDKWYSFDGDTVKGYMTASEVLAFMTTIAALPPKAPRSGGEI
jgi:hypothetical protein